MPDTPTFTTLGDEPIEARIVAWVLGEAAAFEAAELERLCEERPELLVFRRRMRALHGLLTEAEAAEPDLAWQLPLDKRQALDEIFGVPAAASVPLAVKRTHHIPYRWLSILAACVLLMFVVFAGFGAGGGAINRAKMVAASQKEADFSPAGGGGEISAEEQRGLDELKKAIRTQEDTVEQTRKVLANITRSRGNIYFGPDSYYRQPGMEDEDGTRSAVDTFNQVETEKMQLESQIGSLLKYSDEQLLVYASGLQLPDNVIKNLYPKFAEQKTQLEGLKREGLGADHPTLLAKTKELEGMKMQIDQGVVSLRDTLQAKLELADARYKRALSAKQERQDDATKKSLGAQDYVDAKQTFESEQQMLQQMKIKLIAEEIAAKMDDSKGPREPMMKVFRGLDKSAPSAPAERLPALAANDSKAAKVPLKLQYPPELIEGTPKPMNLPGLVPAPTEPPTPAGTMPGAASEADALQAMSLADNDDAPANRETVPSSSEFKARPRVQPRGPAAGDAGVIAAADVGKDFSGTVNYGAPIGGPQQAQRKLATDASLGGSGGVGGGMAVEGTRTSGRVNAKEKMAEAPGLTKAGAANLSLSGGNTYAGGTEITAGSLAIKGNRSGDDAISRNSIDAILNNPRPAADPAKWRDAAVETATLGQLSGIRSGGLRADLNGLEEKSAEGRNKKAQDPAAKVPTLGDLPVVGHLFFDSDADGAARPKSEVVKGLQDAKGRKELEGFVADGEDSDESLRSNPAMDLPRAREIDQVRRSLYTAEGAFNLGKFDQAKGEYEKTLKVDPYNSAARRGLEKVAEVKSASYRAAYDQTRAELLMDVDKAWELAAPADAQPSQPKPTLEIIREFDARRAAATPAEQPIVPGKPAAFPVTPAAPSRWTVQDESTKARIVAGVTTESGLAEREMVRRANSVVEADQLAKDAREAYAKGDFQRAYANHEKALNLLPVAPATNDRRAALRELLGQTAVALAEQAVSQGRGEESGIWLGKALEWNPRDETARKLQIIDPASEISAAAEPYSTFSLSISDASFRTAQAALAKGERPEPEGVRVEQFYNAVDYGDPAPAAKEPVAATVEQAAHPVVPGRNLVRVALRTGATGRSAAQPLQLTLLVDQSGSMAREDRRTAMKQALTGLAGLLGPNDKVTVVGFSLTARMLADGLKGDQAGKLSESVNQAASEGGTNLEGALLLAKQLAEARKVAGAQNRVVLFTDGAANLGNADPAQLAETVKAMRQSGLAFDVAGIGTSELNDRLLAELARHGNGRFYVVGAADADDGFAKQLAGAFRPAAENVKVQVRFNPQRVGGYKLIGFEEHRLNKEDFRNDQVDAAELAAEEAGVALYQVEPLPTGSGELGEVSVRFRDAATGEMVERSWSIPYDSSAPVFDRAAPSLQLAGLAMLAAEKLRGGPFGDSIDFSRFAPSKATVKQAYPNNRRVAEVLEMVEALR